MSYDREALLARFTAEQVDHFTGRGGIPLSYIAHPTIRRRLIDAGGTVDFRLVTPVYELNGALVAHGEMVINGEMHHEVGTEPVPGNPMMMADAIKMAVSDCWKRCAMSFGVGLELWEGEEEDWKAAPPPVAHPAPVQQASYAPVARSQPRTINQRAGGPPPSGAWEERPMSDRQRDWLNGLARQMGWTGNVEHELEGVGKSIFGEDWVFDFVKSGEASKIIDVLKAEVESRRSIR